MAAFSRIPVWFRWTLLLAALAGAVFLLPDFSRKKIDYNTQVKPILNKHCMACHGGVKRKAGFSLLTREEALTPTESGQAAIVPGHPELSEFIRRLGLHDPEERMPYKEDPLDKEQIAILTQWVKEGAAWETHWSYQPMAQVKVPRPAGRLWGLLPAPENPWVRNDIDWFVWDKLQAEKLQPAPEADKATLLQRVSMDLTGLPAPPDLAARYMADSSAQAYERLVDALLERPQYGERWASMWLDVARYADSKGYESDGGRNIWRYRDWVIRAFNADMPYDRFLTEQLAGDLLPDPGDDQLIATAFHRNAMCNDEGGTDNEEFRVAAVIDRVNTTWEGLMGTTFSCVQCHSHPYDPFHHEEYYQFMAFFNSTRDEDTGEEYPFLRHFTGKDSADLLTLQGWLQQNATPEQVRDISLFIKTWQPAYYSLACDSMTNAALYDTKWATFRHQGRARLPGVTLDSKTRLLLRYSSWVDGGSWSLHLDGPEGPALISEQVVNTRGRREIKPYDFQEIKGRHDLWFRYENPQLKKEEDAGFQLDWMSFNQPFPASGKPGADSAEAVYWRLLRAETKGTPILLDARPDMARSTRVFERGNWLVPGAEVQAATPKTLLPLPENAPANRLGLAQWITHPDHPLTARTMVNRVWEQLYGAGLAETLEDLGSQGIPPEYRELIDYLAWQYIHEYKWSTKKLLRTLVLSATYRQDARATPELLERDPNNRLYARGARVRLGAEQIRDKALAASGLLSAKMYGPSVMPYQPGGIWKTPWNGEQWVISQGEDQYRRSVYTYWKRSSPYPSAMIFDGASRVVCSARRIRTNTPLQALVTLNDSTYVTAARHLALRAADSRVENSISRCYEWAIGKMPDQARLAVLQQLYEQSVQEFRQKPESIAGLMGAETPPETAALTVVANAILNLDEFVTKN